MEADPAAIGPVATPEGASVSSDRRAQEDFRFEITGAGTVAARVYRPGLLISGGTLARPRWFGHEDVIGIITRGGRTSSLHAVAEIGDHQLVAGTKAAPT